MVVLMAFTAMFGAISLATVDAPARAAIAERQQQQREAAAHHRNDVVG